MTYLNYSIIDFDVDESKTYSADITIKQYKTQLHDYTCCYLFFIVNVLFLFLITFIL